MQAIFEIKNSEAVAKFIARPRIILGTTILVAGLMLLTFEVAKVFYR
ncbi:hypothetical protein ABMA08_07925 [Pseudomonas yamanorum]